MPSIKSFGLEQARLNLPAVVARAHEGKVSVITRHGQPYAAVVPVSAALASRGRSGLLDLRGTGKGLWGRSAARMVDKLREEWG